MTAVVGVFALMFLFVVDVHWTGVFDLPVVVIIWRGFTRLATAFFEFTFFFSVFFLFLKLYFYQLSHDVTSLPNPPHAYTSTRASPISPLTTRITPPKHTNVLNC